MTSLAQRFLTLLLALMLAFGSVTAVVAQDDDEPETEETIEATDEEDEDDGDPNAAAGDDDDREDRRAARDEDEDEDNATPAAAGGDIPTVGTAVIVISNETGEEVAEITVTDVVDEFAEFDDFYEPEDGFRYVAVELSIQNLVQNDRYEVYTYDYALTSLQGTLFSSAYVLVDEDSIEQYPELLNEPILGGESASGWIFFAVPDEAELEGFYYNTFDTFLLVASVAGGEISRPSVGATSTLYNEEGDEIADITIDEYLPEFDDDDGLMDLQDGFRYVAVYVVIDNLIPNDRFEVYTYNLRLVTDTGVSIYPTYMYFDDDESEYLLLEDGEILGGETGEGYVFYAVPEDAELSSLYYTESSQALVLADLAE